MIFRILDDVTVAVHYLVMAYIVFGGFLAWRWRRTIWLHGVAIAWALTTLLFNVDCPLTALENFLRAQAGQAPLSGGFIDTYLTGVFYPASYANMVEALAGLTVAVSWLGGYARYVRRRHDQVDQVDDLKLG